MAKTETEPVKPVDTTAGAEIPTPPTEPAPTKVGEVWSPPTKNMEKTDLTLKMLIYGQSGIGKTRLAASAADVPSLSPVLFVDAEAGTMSIRERTTLNVFRMSDYQALQKFVSFMRGGVEKDYKTVVIDSLSDVGRVVLRQCVLDAKRANSAHDPEIPDQRDWGRYTERVKIIVRSLRDAPVNVILTALVREDKDELTGKISYRPGLQGQEAARDVMAYMDIVGYFAPVGGGKSTPTLFFDPNSQYVAKDRSGTLVEAIANPTFSQLYQFISGGKK